MDLEFNCSVTSCRLVLEEVSSVILEDLMIRLSELLGKLKFLILLRWNDNENYTNAFQKSYVFF